MPKFQLHEKVRIIGPIIGPMIGGRLGGWQDGTIVKIGPNDPYWGACYFIKVNDGKCYWYKESALAKIEPLDHLKLPQRTLAWAVIGDDGSINPKYIYYTRNDARRMAKLKLKMPLGLANKHWRVRRIKIELLGKD